ncbi:uncharacterized protein LOC132192689 [Neocloeon triangulifer]|uniref:uncharacterized protein LOC132192689 n=1 Tax=Neocloeon triangulifer TaxID=2078957 RepID=UPI00286F08DB|nr:uncharacterized protein LOC132192689 [Neocloeon triangulifer]
MARVVLLFLVTAAFAAGQPGFPNCVTELSTNISCDSSNSNQCYCVSIKKNIRLECVNEKLEVFNTACGIPHCPHEISPSCNKEAYFNVKTCNECPEESKFRLEQRMKNKSLQTKINQQSLSDTREATAVFKIDWFWMATAFVAQALILFILVAKLAKKELALKKSDKGGKNRDDPIYQELNLQHDAAPVAMSKTFFENVKSMPANSEYLSLHGNA